jgi:triacylglycerol lipase
MPIAYHSDCCPETSLEMALLILEAYRAYQDARNNLPPRALLSIEMGEYRVLAYIRAKVLPFSRYKMMGFVAAREDKAYLIFRGTESVSEWVGDSRCLQVVFREGWGKVHKGFREIYKSCSESILETLSEIEENVSMLYVGGHSLGAALSTLACADISENTRFTAPIQYTFASPRVGDRQFADTFQQKIAKSYRMMNTEDFVITEPKPAILGKLPPFCHVGIPFAFTHHGQTALENHLIESYMLYL